jgi:hypothetical protein
MGNLLLVIGIAFAPLAAAMAFAITYEEWSHHGLRRTDLIKRSLQMAVVTLGVFLVVSVAVGVLMGIPRIESAPTLGVGAWSPPRRYGRQTADGVR